jgi:hypothetical protein
MAKEISDFDSWLQVIEDAIQGAGLIDSLNAIALCMSRDFGVHLWFVEVLGKRWSYIAGEIQDQPPRSTIHRVELKGNTGLVSDTWEELSETDRDKLIKFLNRLISQGLPALRDEHKDSRKIECRVSRSFSKIDEK